jgi:hypothetical protein
MASIIPDLISVAEDRIYRNLRVRAMEESLSDTIASGVIAVPSDYVDLKHAYISSTSPYQWLERKAAEWVYRNDPYRSGRTGIPKYIAREGSNFIFSPYPSDTYTVSGIYYKRLDSIATSTNDIFTTHPGLWLFGTLAESAPYIQNDQRMPMWEQKFIQLLTEVNAEEYRENSSGSRLAMTAELMNTNS